MGKALSCECNECHAEFSVSDGGGFIFYIIRCDKCGREKDVCFDELGDLYKRYIKTIGTPYSSATHERDMDIIENYNGDPITEEEYYAAISEKYSPCSCGGTFTMHAPPRCPECGSTDFTSEVMCYYD